MTCCLYKHLNASGEVLYVGIASEVWKRSVQHEGKSSWFKDVRTIEVEHFPNREAAIEAEETTVMALKPRFNVDYLLPRHASVIEKRRAVVGPDHEALKPVILAQVAQHGLAAVARSVPINMTTLSRFLFSKTVPYEKTVAALVAHFKGEKK
jgi:predicted GIY-YIG superfamily endonuclease